MNHLTKQVPNYDTGPIYLFNSQLAFPFSVINLLPFLTLSLCIFKIIFEVDVCIYIYGLYILHEEH